MIKKLPLVMLALWTTACHQAWCSPQASAGSHAAGSPQAASARWGVVSPEHFAYPTRLGYEAAVKYPQVISELFCYCGCDHIDNHGRLLDCFKSEHSANCAICQQEAITAGQLAARSCSLKEIRTRIESFFSKQYPFKEPSPVLRRYREQLRAQGIDVGETRIERRASIGHNVKGGETASSCCIGQERQR